MKPFTQLFLLILVTCVIFTACSSDNQPFTTPSIPSTLVTITAISPANVVLERGDTRQYTATVEANGTIPKTVKWAVIGGVAGTTISSNGLLTVANNETATALTITATSEFDNSQSANATTNLKQVTAIAVNPSPATVVPGQTQQFTAVVSGSNNPPQTVEWTVSGGVTGTNINNSGLLTVANNETSSSLTVTATSTYDRNKTGTTSISTTYTVGIIGPGGGYVFYDKGSYSNGWRFLEAAPVSSEFRAQWGLYGIACPGTQDGIGTGRANTTAIINILNANNQTGRAAQLCAALNINGLNDWFLPSKDELNEMWKALKRDRNNIGGFNLSGDSYQNGYPGWYWSSSAYSATTLYSTWFQRFSDGYQASATVGATR